MNSPFLDALSSAFSHATWKGEDAVLPSSRAENYEAFRKVGLPGRDDEAWKYTPLRGLNETSFSFPERRLFAPESDAGIKNILSRVQRLLGSALSPEHTHLIFINGFFLEPASLPPGLSVEKMDSPGGVAPSGSFDLLNRSFAVPVFFRLGKDVGLEKPVHFIFVSGNVDEGAGSSLMSFPRFSFHLERGSRASVLESHFRLNEGGVSTFSNSHSSYVLSGGSALRFHQICAPVSPASVSGGMAVSEPTFELDRDSRLTAFFATVGAVMERTNVRVRLGAEGAEAGLSGIYLLEESRHTDFHLDIHHAVPNTTSAQTFKGILNQTSRAVFTGKVRVDKGARGSNSAQLSQTLLLGTKAQIDARPQLEILNNDVKCSHGATVGRLSEKEIFYLRSRGLSKDEASRLLCLGFIRELLEGVEDASIRSLILDNFRKNTQLGRDL